MNKQLKDSVLGRASKKHRRFHSLINKLKRYPSDTGLVEDTTSSSVIIRVIVGLLLLHLALIGGALLRGLDKRLANKINIPFHIAEDPLHCVARGTAIALKNVEKFSFLMR